MLSDHLYYYGSKKDFEKDPADPLGRINLVSYYVSKTDADTNEFCVHAYPKVRRARACPAPGGQAPRPPSPLARAPCPALPPFAHTPHLTPHCAPPKTPHPAAAPRAAVPDVPGLLKGGAGGLDCIVDGAALTIKVHQSRALSSFHLNPTRGAAADLRHPLAASQIGDDQPARRAARVRQPQREDGVSTTAGDVNCRGLGFSGCVSS